MYLTEELLLHHVNVNRIYIYCFFLLPIFVNYLFHTQCSHVQKLMS